jgi:hypothetical protein
MVKSLELIESDPLTPELKISQRRKIKKKNKPYSKMKGQPSTTILAVVLILLATCVQAQAEQKKYQAKAPPHSLLEWAFALADKMSAWIRFARTGNPNHPGLPALLMYMETTGATMKFDNISVVRNHPDKEVLEMKTAGPVRF